jgi:hypothetical protein
LGVALAFLGLTPNGESDIYSYIRCILGVKVKDRLITVKVESAFWDRLNSKSIETGIPYAVVVRRSLERWVNTGEIPPAQEESPKATKTKPGKPKSSTKAKARP